MNNKPMEVAGDWQIACLRAGAFAFDTILVCTIVCTPILFNIAALPPIEANVDFLQTLGHALSKDKVAVFALLSLLTPLPLIYWRLCFRVLMHSRTPGEILFRICPTFYDRRHLIVKECFYALLQYVYLLLSLVLGTFTWMLLGTFFMTVLGMFADFWPYVPPFAFSLVWLVCVFHSLVLCHRDHLGSLFSGSFERLLGLETILLNVANSALASEAEASR